MPERSSFIDSYEPVAADELVTFSILVRPRPDITLDRYRDSIARSAVDDLQTSPAIRERIASNLRSLGFEVFDIRGPVVFARGTVAQFEAVFGGKLRRLIRRYEGRPDRPQTAIVADPEAEAPSADRVEGALLVTLMKPPVLANPRLAPGECAFCVRLPGDLAQITRASATHRGRTSAGASATAADVVVAVVDTGFAPHPYYADHGYRIIRTAAPDTQNPEQDDDWHGTYVVANLLACAPDVELHAVKFGRIDLAFAVAMAITHVRVISLSWIYELSSNGTLPDEVLGLLALVLLAVNNGIVVVVAAGNEAAESVPAAMPEVIAVGGAQVDHADQVTVWNRSTSYRSTSYPGRRVPDLCGIASRMMLPMPETAGGKPFGWDAGEGETSCATPQVAGVAALLIQKDPTLSPNGVRDALVNHAFDITSGQTFNGDVADHGPDDATGGGLVDALAAWQAVNG